MSKGTRIQDVLDLIDPPKGFQPWHGGPSVMGCLRGINAKQAGWKPAPGRNSIWDLVLHMAYWKYVIIRKLNEDHPKGFERSPSNFPYIPDPTNEGQWKEDKGLLRKRHDQLVKEIRQFPQDRLDALAPGKKDWTYAQLIIGIAAHDVYHIGQIQVLKKLYKEMGNS